MLLIYLKLKNWNKKVRIIYAEVTNNSRKWCAEFASYSRRIHDFFGAEFWQPYMKSRKKRRSKERIGICG